MPCQCWHAVVSLEPLTMAWNSVIHGSTPLWTLSCNKKEKSHLWKIKTLSRTVLWANVYMLTATCGNFFKWKGLFFFNCRWTKRWETLSVPACVVTYVRISSYNWSMEHHGSPGFLSIQKCPETEQVCHIIIKLFDPGCVQREGDTL